MARNEGDVRTCFRARWWPHGHTATMLSRVRRSAHWSVACGCLFLAVLWLAGEIRVLACSCYPSKPPCEDFWTADAVFSGEVSSIALLDAKARETKGRHGEGVPLYVRVRFRVDAPYRGISTDEVDVSTGLGGGDCGYGFEKGKQYLVYAYRSEQSADLHTGICTRTCPIAEATEDLAYIKSISASGEGRIFGTITEFGFDSANRFEPVARGALRGVTVIVTQGERRFSVETDAEGAYEIAGLATGKGTFTVELPPHFALFEKWGQASAAIDVEVHAGGCSRVDVPVGRVSLYGKVLDEKGVPTATNVYLLLLSEPEFQLTLISGKDGRFAFVGAPPGKYVLATGVGRIPTVGSPHTPSFHPGVDDVEQATVFVISRETNPPDVVHRLPEPIAQVEIAGVAVWPDGSPASGVEINVEEATGYGRSTTDYKSGEDGRFSFPTLVGAEYKVYAEYRFGEDGLIRSTSIVVRVGADARPIRLVVGTELKSAEPVSSPTP